MPTRPISLPLRPGLEFPEWARAWKVWRETWTRPRLYAEPVIIEMLNRVDADVMGATKFSVWLISTAGAKPKTSRMLMKPCKTWRRARKTERVSVWKDLKDSLCDSTSLLSSCHSMKIKRLIRMHDKTLSKTKTLLANKLKFLCQCMNRLILLYEWTSTSICIPVQS